MAGIIEEQMGPPPEAEQPRPGQPPVIAPEAAAGGEQDFEDEESYDKFMLVLEGMLADKKQDLMGKIAGSIDEAQDLPRVLATAAYDLVAAVDEKTQGIIADGDISTAGAETLAMIAEIAEARGKKIDGRVAAQAVNIMMRRMMEEAGDVEGLERMNGINQQDIAGHLDSKFAEAGEEPVEEEKPGEMEEEQS